MPPTAADRLAHILTAIEASQDALANKQIDDLTRDLMLRLAVERALEIICEASRRIPDELKTKRSDINWRSMIDFGNELRHAYHRVNPALLWEIVHRDLPPLKDFAEQVLREEQK